MSRLPVGGVLVLVLSAQAWGQPSPRAEHDALLAALAKFEGSLQPLLTGPPAARAEAVMALGQVLSPQLPAARDALAADSDRTVLMSLHRALDLARDSSPEAREILIRGLSHPEHAVAASASSAIFSIKVHVPFESIWDSDASQRFFVTSAPTMGFDFELLDGVDAAKPWEDAAWEHVPLDLRCRLLARAGSRESLSRLVATVDKEGVGIIGRLALPAAEPIDLVAVRNLLSDPRPELRTFASASLLDAGEDVHLREVRERLREAADLPAAEQRRRVAGLALNDVMERADAEMLRLLSRLQLPQYFYGAEERLRNLDEPLAFADLKARYDLLPPLPPMPPPGRSWSDITDDERDASNYRIGLLRALVRALARERRYDELGPLLSRLLAPGSSNAVSPLNDFENTLRASPELLAALPADASSACVANLRSYLKAKAPDGRFLSNGDQRDALPALKLLGLLARGADADELWARFRETPGPFQSFEVLTPIAWGFSRRTEDLRRELAPHWGSGWFHVASNVGEFVKGYPGTNPGGACAGTWNPIEIVASQASIIAARRELALDLERLFPPRDARAFWTAFVAARGTARGGPPRPGPDVDLAVRSGPPMTAEDRAWLTALLRRLREDRFKALTARGNPVEREIVCGVGPRATPELVAAPAGTFLGAGIAYADDVRKLLRSPDPINRHESVWALWQWRRDPEALQVLLADAEAPDTRLRASALNILRRICHQPAAPLFPRQLQAATPELRQLGLLGVRTFGLTSALPDVQMLVTDPNPTVAATAVTVLGDMRPPGTRDLLLGLLGEGGALAGAAASALAKLRAREDLDGYIARLGAPETSSDERWLLLDVLRDATGERFTWFPDPDRAPGKGPRAEVVDEWKSWWAENRDKSPEEWFRSRLGLLVRDYTTSKDRSRTLYARTMLRMAPVGSGSEIADKYREAVARWWQDNGKASAWDLLCKVWYPESQDIPRLLVLAPDRTRRHIFQNLVRTAQVSGAQSESSTHREVVALFGVDFGDPTLASCETRDKVLADWLAWGDAQAWAR